MESMTTETAIAQAIAHMSLACMIAAVMTGTHPSLCSGESSISAIQAESTQTMSSLGLYLACNLAGSITPHADDLLQLTGAAKTKE